MDNELSNQSNKLEEEEYQFSPEAESNSAAFAASPTAATKANNIFDKLKRKNLLIGAGVIVVVFIVYKLADVLFATTGSHHVPPPVTAAAITPIPATPTQLVAPPSNGSSGQSSMAPMQPAVSDAVNNRLSDIASRQADYQAGLEKLNSQLSDMQNSLSALNNQVSSLSSAMQTLASQFAAQQAAVEATKKAAQKKIAQQKAAPKPIYFARSMIPGRAWLLTQNGETVTVSVGNNLPGYGTVISIDPVQGTVTTSTGAIIGYSPGDS
jgi:intracellular multiplication protein IcmG